jgi:DNA-binding transcriptional LysR family regulator
MITLHKLALFRVVYEQGSFNRAAQSLYLAQSVVSQHIQDLEATLGVQLFKRTARGVQPTPAGERLYEYAGRILDLVKEAERVVTQADEAAEQTLTVAATPGVSVYLLPRWLNHFQQQHPSISVQLQTALTVDVVRDVQAGHYDLGFIEAEPTELKESSLHFHRIREVTYWVVASPDHAWHGRASVTVEELLREPFIARQPSSRARKWLEAVLGRAAAHLRIVAELDSPGAIKFALLNGMGVSILPDYVVEREVERSELMRLALEGVDLKRSLLMLWNAQRPLTPVQRAFIEVLAVFAPEVDALL